ncbi:hypothetical protein K2Z84_21395 [Candidatus Binatia bacterium]|nr:hypothetical protein [Candidatus Binatia bacterium]
MRSLIVATAVLLLPATALADAGGTAAALQGEKAECRYFKTLCDRATQLYSSASAKSAELKALNEKGGQNWTMEDRRRAEELRDEARGTARAMLQAANDAVEARDVIQAKHDKPLACLACEALK